MTERLPVLFQQSVKSPFGLSLRMKTLDDPHPRHIFMDKGIQVGRLLAENLPARMRFYLNIHHTRRHKRDSQHGSQSQLRVLPDHDHHHRYDCQAVRDQRSHTVGQHVFQGIDIADDTGQNLPRRPAVKKSEIQLLNMRIQLLPDRQQDLVADLRHNVHPQLHRHHQQQVDD